MRTYGYFYDNLNRLKDATYQKAGSTTKMYDENLSYDRNGNIQTLKRNGDNDAQMGIMPIDDLSYTYNGNQLQTVTDTTNKTSGFNDDNTSGADYGYDANGNMTVDKNKKITNITYNNLNLPTKINFQRGGDFPTISYIYNANGVKLQKIVYNGSRIFMYTTTDYLGGFQYSAINTSAKGGNSPAALQIFPTAEGYYDAIKSSYVYNYTDHLGNVRMSYSDSDKNGTIATTEILEESSYYPFGLKHSYAAASSQPNYKYKYNGKELQDELGLNFYDYGNRNYDAAIGRFHNMDRFAEKYFHLNPYQYGANNPVIYNDIKGDSILIYSKQDKTHIKYDNGNLYSKNSKTGKWETYNGKNVKVDKNGNKSIGGFLGKAVAALDKIRSGNAGGELISTIQNDPKYVRIGEGSNQSGGVSGSVSWDPSNTTGGSNQQGSSNRPSYIGLAHELGHALDGLDGVVSNMSIGNIGGANVTAAEYEAMHWENRVRGENGVSLRTHYGNDTNGSVVGQALNPNGTSSLYTQQLVMPTAHLQTQFTPSGMQVVPVSGTTTLVIPFKY